jgi:hypothetical protein
MRDLTDLVKRCIKDNIPDSLKEDWHSDISYSQTILSFYAFGVFMFSAIGAFDTLEKSNQGLSFLDIERSARKEWGLVLYAHQLPGRAFAYYGSYGAKGLLYSTAYMLEKSGIKPDAIRNVEKNMRTQ